MPVENSIQFHSRLIPYLYYDQPQARSSNQNSRRVRWSGQIQTIMPVPEALPPLPPSHSPSPAPHPAENDVILPVVNGQTASHPSSTVSLPDNNRPASAPSVRTFRSLDRFNTPILLLQDPITQPLEGGPGNNLGLSDYLREERRLNQEFVMENNESKRIQDEAVRQEKRDWKQLQWKKKRRDIWVICGLVCLAFFFMLMEVKTTITSLTSTISSLSDHVSALPLSTSKSNPLTSHAPSASAPIHVPVWPLSIPNLSPPPPFHPSFDPRKSNGLPSELKQLQVRFNRLEGILRCELDAIELQKRHLVDMLEIECQRKDLYAELKKHNSRDFEEEYEAIV